ncbi:DUF3102 domain-containing protein [Ktedonospora formicarum]|uniref:DUF3102 domain-containing protein n=1 Tax=Ktedonospora formicarum TaxID=2778364 RepID=A0A8J3I219_9CHLR|nr:DUF3102 domain-containing protein [Ktedonospora formicarum]GHO48602.1 hypothetical protein KSX_67650 [Ktedonospora formicarum]
MNHDDPRPQTEGAAQPIPITEQIPPAALSFEYEALSPQDRAFVEQKTAETLHLLRRTAEAAIAIGYNLQAVRERLPHGQFMHWVLRELGMRRQTCQNFLNVASAYGERLNLAKQLPLKVLYELAAAPEAIRQQVEAAQIPTTIDAIRAAKADLKAAQEAEMQARQETEAMRQELANLQARSEEIERARTDAQEALFRLQEERQRQEQETSEEGKEPIIPPDIEQRLHTLHTQIETLTTQRDTLSAQVVKMGEQMRGAVLQHNALPAAQKFRQRWRKAAAEMLLSGTQFVAQQPSPLELEGLEMEDWTTLERIETLLGQVHEMVQHIHASASNIVDAE